MPHPLVQQLRFTRSEFRRALDGVPPEDAAKRMPPLNSLAWSVGHLAWQEQRYFLTFERGVTPFPEIETAFRSGAPATTPDLSETLPAWETITHQSDPWLDTLTTERLTRPYTQPDGNPGRTCVGNLLQRVIYHYWYHLGENMALRKMLGHGPLPQFVGDLDEQAPYTPESG
ncbi:MAG: DinB family protein [Trueperaceae bacterium]